MKYNILKLSRQDRGSGLVEALDWTPPPRDSVFDLLRTEKAKLPSAAEHVKR